MLNEFQIDALKTVNCFVKSIPLRVTAIILVNILFYLSAVQPMLSGTRARNCGKNLVMCCSKKTSALPKATICNDKRFGECTKSRNCTPMFLCPKNQVLISNLIRILKAHPSSLIVKLNTFYSQSYLGPTLTVDFPPPRFLGEIRIGSFLFGQKLFA